MPGQTLTPRERAVLAAVGRRLNNSEIAAELFISVRTVESHIAALRRKLGADTRADLVAAAGARRGSPVRVPATAFLGRDAELADLHGRLARHRWATVAGPGGVGKTRLALEYARAHEGELVPLVVELEHAGPDDVVARIARAVELESARNTDLLAAVGLALAAHPYVVVLDNVDRVGDQVHHVVDALMASAPELRVITTSRTPLGAESVLHIDPLATDGPATPAVRMFLDRLDRSGRPPSPGDRELAEEVCRRVDGLPLAIELAAGVARHLSLAELAARLDRDFATLDRAAPAGRHRTLETAFEWTWDLLTDEERDVLCRLAALPRTFDVDLATAVTHPGAEGVVLRLLDHSMLAPATGSRFRVLAVMREFVQARTHPAVIRDVLERHAEFYAEIARHFVRLARVDDSPAAMGRSALLCPEVNAALRWALAAEHPTALSLAASLSVGIEQYGSDADSVHSIAIAARDARVRREATTEDLLAFGIGLCYLDLPLVDELAGLALDAAAGGDADERSRLAAHHLAGMSDAYRDRGAAAIAHLDEAEGLAIALDDEWELAAVRQMRGIALRDGSIGEPAAAIAEFASAMHGYALAGDAMHVNNARYMMAITAAEHGLHAGEAAGWAAECVDYASRVGNTHELAHATLVQQMLQVPDAAAELGELTETFRRLGDARCLTRCLFIAADRAAPADALPRLEEALHLADMAGDEHHQIAALERLVGAYWAAGDRMRVRTALGRLELLAGPETASTAATAVGAPVELATPESTPR
ncbi:ATP-binding protein [Agromyces aerolatus]|uniref:ATP-binding protein n=1 Tax=Agromyces sp. LY-1074 TaxID=3074080 RepID=UPI0028542818|nr:MULTISPECIES: LuxR C-terminal-related transcriptional regulator [unclassified Agromyces]MDR5699675.1 LuxR C-terminal-related transcriptional regulator [Agromyces sp. LY-1074]MDR5705971.1 LuxR C-terminal-related transcriptional regulator [Agromyces sp. LY-1358]